MSGLMTLLDFLSAVYVPSRIDLRAESVDQVRFSIRCWERFLGRAPTLADFTEDALRRFLSSYRLSHAAATTNSKRCQLLALWRCAWEEEYLPNPPRTSRVRRARAETRIPEAWSPREVGAIIRAAESESAPICGLSAAAWWKAIILVAYDTGERRKALLSATPADVSLAGGWITFRTRKTIPRICPLSAESVEAVRRIYDQYRDQLFCWPHSRKWLDVCFAAICRRAGVTFGRAHGGLFHKLRRTAGTLAESVGLDGARWIGNTRRIFETHYRDPRFLSSGIERLPRPAI